MTLDEFYEHLKGVSESAKPLPEKHIEDVTATAITVKNIFVYHDLHPLVLNFVLLANLGTDWLTWQPETLWAEIKHIFKSEISELTRAKIQTLRTLHVSNSPWEKWQVFEKIVQGLNNNIPRWDIMQAPDLDQLYACIDIIDQIRQVSFKDEVKLYMAAAVLNEDVTYVPAPLDFIQLEVSQPFTHCNSCGRRESALFSDGICTTCSKRLSPEQGLSLQPKMNLISKGIGKDVSTFLKFDPSAVQVRWEEEKNKPRKDVILEENPVDVQVAKLLIARDYMNLKRQQLYNQLVILKPWLNHELTKTSNFMFNVGNAIKSAPSFIGHHSNGIVENVGSTLVEGATHPLAALRSGIEMTKKDLKGGSLLMTGLTLGFPAYDATKALKKVDPEKKGRSRIARVAELAGDTAGGLIGTPYGFSGAMAGGMAGHSIGKKVGETIDKVRGYKPKPVLKPIMPNTANPALKPTIPNPVLNDTKRQV